jgi:hypothetical protein
MVASWVSEECCRSLILSLEVERLMLGVAGGVLEASEWAYEDT